MPEHGAQPLADKGMEEIKATSRTMGFQGAGSVRFAGSLARRFRLEAVGVAGRQDRRRSSWVT